MTLSTVFWMHNCISFSVSPLGFPSLQYHWLDMTRYIAVKTQDSKLIANLCQSCSRASPRLRQPCKAPPAVHQMRNAHHMPASRPLSNCDCNGCEHQTIRFVRPSPGGGPRPAYSCARCCRLCALALLLATRLSSPRRRRPASVSNCCGRPTDRNS